MELALARQYNEFYSYSGEIVDIHFETVASAINASMLRDALEAWSQAWRLIPVHLIIEDEPAFGLFGFDLARRYRVRYLVHGSPFLIPVAAWVALVAAVGVLGAIWLVGTFSVQTAYWEAMGERYEVLQNVDPEKIPEVAAAMDKTVPKPPTAPGLPGIPDLGEVVKWGALGLVGFLAISLVKEIRR